MAARKRRQRNRVMVKEPEVVEDELEELEEAQEVITKPAARKRRRRPFVVDRLADSKESEDVPEQEAEPTEAEPAEAETDWPITDRSFGEVLRSLPTGVQIQIVRSAGDKWLLSVSDNQAAPAPVTPARKTAGLSGNAYWAEVCDGDYLEWEKEWVQLTTAEKEKRAIKAGAVWDAHDNPRVEIMRITMAYRVAAGIEKYKPAYASREARKAVREGR